MNNLKSVVKQLSILTEGSFAYDSNTQSNERVESLANILNGLEPADFLMYWNGENTQDVVHRYATIDPNFLKIILAIFLGMSIGAKNEQKSIQEGKS